MKIKILLLLGALGAASTALIPNGDGDIERRLAAADARRAAEAEAEQILAAATAPAMPSQAAPVAEEEQEPAVLRAPHALAGARRE